MHFTDLLFFRHLKHGGKIISRKGWNNFSVLTPSAQLFLWRQIFPCSPFCSHSGVFLKAKTTLTNLHETGIERSCVFAPCSRKRTDVHRQWSCVSTYVCHWMCCSNKKNWALKRNILIHILKTVVGLSRPLGWTFQASLQLTESCLKRVSNRITSSKACFSYFNAGKFYILLCFL